MPLANYAKLAPELNRAQVIIYLQAIPHYECKSQLTAAGLQSNCNTFCSAAARGICYAKIAELRRFSALHISIKHYTYALCNRRARESQDNQRAGGIQVRAGEAAVLLS